MAGGLVWSDATLDAFLSDPHEFLPHSRMSFDGMEGADDRAALLAWLRGFFRQPLRSAACGADRSRPEEYGLDPQILDIQGDPEYGAYLAGECTTCHRIDGADEGIPSITGWPAR